MQDWLFRHGQRERLINWMGLDSKIDSTLAETWAAIRDYWNAGTSFFARFKLTGWRRLAKRFRKKFVHLPLSRFADSTVAQLRMVHVLNGQEIRSYAAEFIRKA